MATPAPRPAPSSERPAVARARSGLPAREGADRCPGVVRLAPAADGLLARVRLPGGFVSAEQLDVLADLAVRLGDGRAELTARGNLQLRGLAPEAAGELTRALAVAGLLPSLDHDRVRNVLASPLAGLDGRLVGPSLGSLGSANNLDSPDSPSSPDSPDSPYSPYSPGSLASPSSPHSPSSVAVSRKQTGHDPLLGPVRALDAAVCARPDLAHLPGRFLFAFDDGRGDVAGLGADVTARYGERGAVINGLAVPAGQDALVATMIAFAEAFLAERAADESSNRCVDRGGSAGSPWLASPSRSVWRIAELPGGPERVRDRVRERLGLPLADDFTAGSAPHAGSAPDAGSALHAGNRQPGTGVSFPEAGPVGVSARPVGVVGPHAVALLAPLGRLSAEQLRWLAGHAVADRPARITPWRSVVLPAVADPQAVLAAAAGAGFGVDTQSPWLRVTACAGRPGCGSALADVQADALRLAAEWPERLVHVSGCTRHCGRPAATEIDITATDEGYRVDGQKFRSASDASAGHAIADGGYRVATH